MEDGKIQWFFIVIIILLITLEAIISCGLAALDAINEKKLKKRIKEKDKKAVKILQFMDEITQYENSMLSILTAMNIIIGVLCLPFFTYFYKKVSASFMITTHKVLLQGGFLFLFFVVLSYVVILFGNVLPRKLALLQPEIMAYKTIRVLNVFIVAWKPIIVLVEYSIRGVLFLLHINPKELDDNVTEDEIISIVNEGLEQGVLENSEVEMISNIIEFDEKEVNDIMTHRQKIVAIDSKLSIEEALKFMLDKRYSRFPLYEEDIDNVIGIIYLKDVTKYYITEQDKAASIMTLAKKPYLVPDTKKIDTLFHEMRLKKIHMAIAIDEYGQTAGIVAMEDILEEIVGNILDEFDVDEKMIIEQRDGRYLIKGLADLEDISKTLDLDMEEEQEDYDTLNGLLISLLGHIPDDKERGSVNYKGYCFHIVDVKNKRIRYVRAVKNNL